MLLERRLSQMIGSESLSTLLISGGSASSGMRSATRLTALRTSFAAASMSRVARNSMLTREAPFWLLESMVLMPSMPASASSRVWVMRVSTTLAEAPG